MHTTYIDELAADLLHRFGKDMSRVAVVFPNKRASLFLNKALARQAATMDDANGDCLWAPAYITISELFRNHSNLEVADQIMLVCRLYDVFQRCTGFKDESLDHFYNWGLLLLSDFDDLDKNMADASKLFQVVTDHHQLDTDDYLSDSQREALAEFFHMFTTEHSSLLRQRFIHLWSQLHNIYETFRQELRKDKLAYEGMLYRDVCEQEDITFEYDHYCFVGFNMLQQVEQHLFKRLNKAGKALFYWDYDNYYLKDNHEAGHFIKEYLPKFPNAMTAQQNGTSSFNNIGEISYISAPTENLQARYVHDWLLEGDRWKAGSRTAIVMCDEHLLQTIIRSLPEEVTEVNVTTGYPLSQSPITSLLQLLIELYTDGYVKSTGLFRQRYLKRVLQHPYASILLTDKEEIWKQTVSANNIGDRLMLLVQYIARQKDALNDFESEALFRTYQILLRLKTLTDEGVLHVDTNTYRRLLTQITNSTTVPYHGEPVAGIQIMGVLETRCLDFDHVLVLSCNEGNMPKGVNDSSFIPHSIRKAYGLTTIEHKVGIYSYYFHRLLQRASDVTLTYNSSTEGLNSGEMSRFMLQLMVESQLPIRQHHLVCEQSTSSPCSPDAIKKDEQMLHNMYERYCYDAEQASRMTGSANDSAKQKSVISPSSLGTYLRCQLRYYYQHVIGLREPDEDTEEMDSKMFGTVFHKAAELAYRNMMDSKGWVYADVISRTLKDPGRIARYVDDAFSEEVFHCSGNDMPSNGGNDRTENNKNIKKHRKPDYNGLHLINRKVIIHLLEDLLRYDLKSAPIKMLGMEKWVDAMLPVKIDDNGTKSESTVRIGGIIDRLDMVGDTIRVIDYKTGFNEPGNIKCIDDIFCPENIRKHTDYYLQTMLYSVIVRNDNRLNDKGRAVSPALLYVQKAHTDGYSPILSIDGQQIIDIKKTEQEYVPALSGIISDILNPEIPFFPTADISHCEHCPFRQMCYA